MALANLVDGRWRKVGEWDYATHRLRLDGAVVWPGPVLPGQRRPIPRDKLRCTPGEFKRLSNGTGLQLDECSKCPVGTSTAPAAETEARGDDGCPCIDLDGRTLLPTRALCSTLTITGDCFSVDYGLTGCHNYIGHN